MAEGYYGALLLCLCVFGTLKDVGGCGKADKDI